jgi:hypothetical protein
MRSRSVAGVLTVWLACLVALAAARVSLAQEPQVEDSVDPPGRVARLSYIDGDVSMVPAGAEEWVEAVQNRPLTSGDKLSVAGGGRAELQVGSATIHLDHNTNFGFIKLDDEFLQTSLTDGVATLHVRRLAEYETIQVETPNASVVLRHVGEYHFEVDSATDRTIVKVRSGEADVVGGANESYKVVANQQGVFTGLDTLTAKIGSIPPRTAFETWAYHREQRDEGSLSAQYVSRDVIGYEDLDDNGDWIHEAQYGHVWRPRYVSYDWAPYRYGRWAYVAPWGWTWVDDSRWGFAPFHYGRWARLHSRWCWVPGPRHLRPVYAPALVGWTGGPSVSVSLSFGSGVGWFPLAPHEVYVPGYRYTPRYIRHVNASNTVIFNNTYINNVYSRNAHAWSYRHRGLADAVTVVSRDLFVGGSPLGGHRFRVNDRDLHHWRDNARPPAIEPDRNSILAGRPRTGMPRDARFMTDGPKSGGDFRSAQQRATEVKRAERRHGNRSQDRFATREQADTRGRQRVEVMRAEEIRGTERRIITGQPPVQSFSDTPARDNPKRYAQPHTPRNSLRQTDPQPRYITPAPQQPRRVMRDQLERSDQARFNQPRSAEPRQLRQRSAEPRQVQPRSEPRQVRAQPRSEPRVTVRNSGSGPKESQTARPPSHRQNSHGNARQPD